jgi:hypothetical protein
MDRRVSRSLFAVGALVCLSAGVASAQQAQQTPQTTTATKSFEIIAVDGNQLVVRLPEGTRELTVRDDFRFTIDGQQMSLRELKPGMKGTATITTTTTVTPVTVTEVKNGTVTQASGSSITVRTDEGYKVFTQSDMDKRGVKIVRDGKVAVLSELRPGDRLTASIVTTKPPQVLTEQQVQATLAREGATPAPPPGGAAPSAAARPETPAGGAAPPAAAQPAPPVAPPAAATPSPRRTLPQTASLLPALGVAGLASLVTAVTIAAIRRRRPH